MSIITMYYLVIKSEINFCLVKPFLTVNISTFLQRLALLCHDMNFSLKICTSLKLRISLSKYALICQDMHI